LDILNSSSTAGVKINGWRPIFLQANFFMVNKVNSRAAEIVESTFVRGKSAEHFYCVEF